MNKRFFNQQNLTRRLRLLSVLFAMLLMPLSAWAVDYDIIVGGVQVTSDNAANVLGDGTVSFTPAGDTTPATLTLNGVTIGTSTANSSIISNLEDEQLTINLLGTNKLFGFINDKSNSGTLAFTGTGSLAISCQNGGAVVRNYNNVTIADGLYIQTNTPGTHWENYDCYRGGGSMVSEMTITTSGYYPIWVLSSDGVYYIQVSDANKDHVLGDNITTVTYNSTDEQLILNGFVCSTTDGEPAIYLGDQEEFKIYLSGDNTISSGGTGYGVYFNREVAILTVSTDKNQPGTLTLGQPTSGNYNLASIPDDCVIYEDGLGFYNNTISTVWPHLVIGDTQIMGTMDKVLNDDKISFDAGTNTLTLSGATIEGDTFEPDIDVYVKDLIVAISGTNTVNGRFYGHYTLNGDNVGTIHFTKAEGATSPSSITISGDTDDSGPVYEFSQCTWDNDLYLTEAKTAGGDNVPGVYYGGGRFTNGNTVPKTVKISTEPSGVMLWIGETAVTSANASNIFAGNGYLDGKVSFTVEDNKNVLILDGANLMEYPIVSDLTNLTIRFKGDCSLFTITSNKTNATLRFEKAADAGDGTQLTGSGLGGSPWSGFGGGVTFGGNLAYFTNSDTWYINNLSSPKISVENSAVSFGVSFGNNIIPITNANDFNFFYTLQYEDKNQQSVTTFTQYDPQNPLTINKASVLTVKARYKYAEDYSDVSIGKYFGAAEDPMRLVYGADPVDFVLAPAIEEGDGIIINGIEANVTYNTGKVSSSTLGRNGAIVSLGYVDANNKTTTLLNNYFNMSFDVVPPAPTIGLAEGTYSSTHEAITVTSDGLENTTIKYQWDDDDKEDYPETGIPFQAGTLKAWVVYTSGETSLSSDIVSATYTVLSEAGLQYVVGDDPVEEYVDYVIGGTGNELTLPTLLNPHNVSVTYASGNTAIATVATDGTVTPVGVGSTTITATSTATSEYEAGEASYTLNVYKDLSHSSITVEVANVTYNGQAKTPTVTVKDGDKVLMYGEDNGDGTLLYEYKVEYANNTNAASATAETGAPTVTVTAYTDDDYSESHMEVTHYRGSATKTFTISPMSISTATVSVDATQTYTYTGSEIKPSVSVSIYLTENAENITTLTEGTDYTVTGYANNTNAATATSENAPTITITGKGNFTGTATGTFTIDQASLGDVTIAPIADQAYTGDQITPAVTVTFNDAAVSTEDYNVVYGENTNAGENAGTVTLTSKNKNFSTSSTKEATFTIVAKELTTSMVADIAAQIYNGTELKPALTVKDGETTLEEDTHYEVTYSNNKNVGTTAKATITGKGNYSGSIDKMFTINKAQLTVTPDDKTYNVGDDITLTVSYKGFVNGETETVLTTQPSASYGTADVTKPGSYEITASGGVAQNYDFIYETGTLTINRQLNVSFSTSNEWATYYGSENLAKPEGLKAYQVTAVDGSTVTIGEIGYIPANTAVLLKNVSNNNTWSNIAASAYTGATSTFASNKLIGTASDVDVSTISGGTVYVLYNNMFKRATGGTIPANRGYLVVEPSAVNAGNAPQLSISIGDENTTGVQTLNVERGTLNDDSWYTIDGRKLQQAPVKKGLYIKNGKKVFINKK